MNSKEKFIDDFSTLSGAAVGVIVLRTKEPYRMLEALKDYSRAKALKFSVWKITNGWNTYKLTVTEEEEDNPTADNVVDIIPALAMLTPLPSDTDNAKGHIHAMMWPHHYCNKGANSIPHVTQYLAEYSQLFTERHQRLVLVVPMEYALPAELEDCVTLVDCELPTQEELTESYEDLVKYANETQATKGRSGKLIEYDEDETNRIIAAGAGMTIMEFESTISRAIKKFHKKLPDVSIDEFVRYVSITKAEIVKRSDVLELMPLGSMNDVGGLENLKTWIEMRKHAFNPEAREFGVDKPKGCALIGPPGTGKSLCAKAAAHGLGLPLIRFDVSRVFAQFVGSSEGRVREALKTIRAMAPCVVMLDEIDKAFNMNSGGGDSGVGQRVLGTILTEMQECQNDVFWIMTANRVTGLPPELLRKGRLDEVFSVTVPNEAERLSILKIHLRKRKQNPDKIPGLDRVAEASAGFVGAELESAVAEAILQAYANDVNLSADLLIEQFSNVVPLSEAHSEQFTAMQEWAEQNAKPSSKDFVPKNPRRIRERSPRPRQSAETLGKRKRNIDVADLDG